MEAVLALSIMAIRTSLCLWARLKSSPPP
jgi:hypothetical protein